MILSRYIDCESKDLIKSDKGETLMGMCGSQARLGMITARINQVEYRNESLAAKKIAMTEESYKIANEYNSTIQDIYDSSTSMSSEDRDAALVKAQSQYDVDTQDLERAETKIDLEMQQLDTERQALTTEKDSIDTALSENIDRTMNLFS